MQPGIESQTIVDGYMDGAGSPDPSLSFTVSTPTILRTNGVPMVATGSQEYSCTTRSGTFGNHVTIYCRPSMLLTIQIIWSQNVALATQDVHVLCTPLDSALTQSLPGRTMLWFLSQGCFLSHGQQYKTLAVKICAIPCRLCIASFVFYF